MNLQHLIDRVHELGEQKSVLTEAELFDAGASKSALDRLVKLDILYPSAEGIYMPDNADFTERHTEVEVAARFPKTVICLATALSFHYLTTQMPRRVWLAYPEGTTKPIEPKLPIYPIAMKKLRFDRGIETHMIEGIPVNIYSQAKTVADCFNYQEYIGIDVAEEAFLQAIAEKRLQISQILEYIELDNLKDYTKRDLNQCIQQAKNNDFDVIPILYG